MNITPRTLRRAVRASRLSAARAQWGFVLARVATAGMGLTVAGSGYAFDFGPDRMFSLTGFHEITASRNTNGCPGGNCQFDPEPNRQFIWADDVVPGRKLSTRGTVFNQSQLWLKARHDLPNGFKLSGSLSQNWRDGTADTPGFWREKNVALSHEEYGTLTIGHMTTRTWGFADFPFGSNIGLSFVWAGSGAGYRNLTQAIRYTSRVLDVADGDLVLEATYDRGDQAFKVHKPHFVELWAHYGKGDLSIDAMLQDTRNGTPSAFGAGVFKSAFYSSVADGRIGANSQSVALLQATYQVNQSIEVSGAIRHNRWSGAYAAVVVPGVRAVWNFPFNVDWGGTLNGVDNPGYPARSTDFAIGARYRMDKWVFSTGLAYFGKARTKNPSDRGQNNTAIVNTLGATYAYSQELELSLGASMVHFRKKGLAPLSMPAHNFVGHDSRVAKASNGFNVGLKYTF